MELNKILLELIGMAKSIKIPVSDRIIPHVFLNSRRKTILGSCERIKSGEYKIILSSVVLEGGEDEVRAVIAHEILHSCRGCANHGKLWQKYAARLGEMIGCEIKRTALSESAEKLREAAPYILRCQSCGQEIRRFRKSAVVKHPERYRCACGGKLILL